MAPPPDIRDTFSLLVLNITFRTTGDDLYPLFSKYGKVADIFIPRDRRTGVSRGFAFVRYKHADEAAKAIERMDGRTVDGREIMVKYAKYGRNEETMYGSASLKTDRGHMRDVAPRPRSPRRSTRDYDREHDRGSDRPRDRDSDRNRDHDRSRDRDYDRTRDRDYERPRYRSRSRSPDRRRRRYSDDERDDSRSKSRSKSRSRSRSRSPVRSKDRARDRSKSRSLSKSRDRSLGRSEERSRSPEKDAAVNGGSDPPNATSKEELDAADPKPTKGDDVMEENADVEAQVPEEKDEVKEGEKEEGKPQEVDAEKDDMKDNVEVEDD